jgi:hypothetical protein
LTVVDADPALPGEDVVDGVALVPPAPRGFIPSGAYLSPRIFELEMREVLPAPEFTWLTPTT